MCLQKLNCNIENIKDKHNISTGGRIGKNYNSSPNQINKEEKEGAKICGVHAHFGLWRVSEPF